MVTTGRVVLSNWGAGGETEFHTENPSLVLIHTMQKTLVWIIVIAVPSMHACSYSVDETFQCNLKSVYNNHLWATKKSGLSIQVVFLWR